MPRDVGVNKLPFGLNKRQKTFCDLLRADPKLNQYQAYIKAYPACKSKSGAMSSASMLLRNPKVVAYLASFDAKITEATGLTQEKIITDILELLEMCLGRTNSPVIASDKDGNINQQMVKKLDSAGAKGALELLAKHKKMLTGTFDIGDKLTVHMNIDLDSKAPKPDKPEEKASTG